MVPQGSRAPWLQLHFANPGSLSQTPTEPRINLPRLSSMKVLEHEVHKAAKQFR